MKSLSINVLKLWILPRMVIIFEEGKKRTLKGITNSSHEVIELCGNSAIHMHSSPINEKGKMFNLTDSREMFLNKNDTYTSTKFQMCLCGSSWDNPLKSFFSFKICNMVLFMWNTTFPSAGGTRIFPTSPMRCGLLTLGSWTTLRLPIASRWPICLPLTLILSEMFNN